MLLHLSDLHFGTEKSACLRAIQSFCKKIKPELVAVSGDLTQRATNSQFSDCKQFLESLEIPYIVIPGNHDIPLFHLAERFIKPFHRYEYFFGATEKILETQHFFVIGLNTIRAKYHTKGSISMMQVERVSQVLEQAPRHKNKIILAHQPFYTDPENSHGRSDCPREVKKALETWSKHGLNAVLHGHLHHVAVYDLNQLFQLQCSHPIWDVHAGTATSYRLHDHIPNSFNLIDTDLNVSRFYFDENLQQFL